MVGQDAQAASSERGHLQGNLLRREAGGVGSSLAVDALRRDREAIWNPGIAVHAVEGL